MHPLFDLVGEPIKEEWQCEFGHLYEKCTSHCELREYVHDESIYPSGDHPSDVDK